MYYAYTGQDLVNKMQSFILKTRVIPICHITDRSMMVSIFKHMYTIRSASSQNISLYLP